MPKIAPAAETPTIPLATNTQFVLDGQPVDVRSTPQVPLPGDTVTLGSHGLFRVIRIHWEYDDETDFPIAAFVHIRREQPYDEG